MHIPWSDEASAPKLRKCWRAHPTGSASAVARVPYLRLCWRTAARPALAAQHSSMLRSGSGECFLLRCEWMATEPARGGSEVRGGVVQPLKRAQFRLLRTTTVPCVVRKCDRAPAMCLHPVDSHTVGDPLAALCALFSQSLR